MRILFFRYLIVLTAVFPAFSNYQLLNEGVQNEDDLFKDVTLSRNGASADVLEVLPKDDVYVFGNQKLLGRFRSDSIISSESLDVFSSDTLTLVSETYFRLKQKKRNNDTLDSALVARVVSSNGFNILLVALFVFIIYLQIVNSNSINHYLNPVALLGSNLFESIYSYRVISFPNFPLLVLYGVVVGQAFFCIHIGDFSSFSWEYSIAFCGLFVVKSVIESLVISFLGERKLGESLHIDFIRMVGLYAIVLSLLALEHRYYNVLSEGLFLGFVSVVFYSWWLLRVVSLLLSHTNFKLFYFFSYLCAFEIVPFLFLAIKLAE